MLMRTPHYKICKRIRYNYSVIIAQDHTICADLENHVFWTKAQMHLLHIEMRKSLGSVLSFKKALAQTHYCRCRPNRACACYLLANLCRAGNNVSRTRYAFSAKPVLL